MGKGFNNYMTKKFFHPSSKENIKRVWMAQQKTEFEKKKEEDMVAQYRKEQDTYENRALLGDEKAKLGLSFMYDAPPGLKKAEKEKEEGEPEYKFEWQRKFNAPREQYAKNDETIRDQPFGIEVRNVRCIKCRQWGHVNTDRICPLFGKDLAAEPPQPKTSASSLLESMREDGFTLKQSLLGKMANPQADNEQMLPSDGEDDPEVKFLKSLTAKQKKKLLKKLNKLQHGQTSGKVEKKKKKRKKEKKNKSEKKRKDSDSSEDESDEEDRKKRSKKKKRKSSESSDSDSDDQRQQQGKEKPNGNHRKSSHQKDSGSPEHSYRNGNMDRYKGHGKYRDTDSDRQFDERRKAKFDHGVNRNGRHRSPGPYRNRDTREFDKGSGRSRERYEGDSNQRRNNRREDSSEDERGKRSNKRSAHRESMSPEHRGKQWSRLGEYDRSGRQKLRNKRDNSSSEDSVSSVERSPKRYNRKAKSPDERIYKRDRSYRSRSGERKRSRSVERQRPREKYERRSEHSSRRDKRNVSDSEGSSSN